MRPSDACFHFSMTSRLPSVTATVTFHVFRMASVRRIKSSSFEPDRRGDGYAGLFCTRAKYVAHLHEYP
jgi:hypothetical protein